MTLYTNARCWTCDMDISVPTYDLAERNYCQPCAFSKLGVYDNRTLLTEDAND